MLPLLARRVAARRAPPPRRPRPPTRRPVAGAAPPPPPRRRPRRPRRARPRRSSPTPCKATGGAAAWNSHKTAHFKIETTFQGMGMGGTGERFLTSAGKSLMVTELAGLGTHPRRDERQGVLDARTPLQGFRFLDGAEAEEARIDVVLERRHAGRSSCSRSSRPRPSPARTARRSSAWSRRPSSGAPIHSCYDAATHLQVLQTGIKATPQGDVPFRAVAQATGATSAGSRCRSRPRPRSGPITLVARIKSVTFDEPMDDKMFDPSDAGARGQVEARAPCVAQGDPLPLRGRHARRRPARGAARLRRPRGGQALHRLRHRPLPGQGLPARGRAGDRGGRRARPGDARRRSPRGRRSCPTELAILAARERASKRQVTLECTEIADADIAIVGAGVMGLAIAYNLAARGRRQADRRPRRALPGVGRVGPQRRRRAPAVVDRDERPPHAGVDGASAPHFAKRDAGQRLDAPGRLPVPRPHRRPPRAASSATSPCRTAAACATRMIAPAEARAHRPRAGRRGGGGFAAACYNPTDGIVFPWPFLWGYARAAEKRGVAIHTGDAGHRDRAARPAAFAWRRRSGTLTAGRVVCAAGAWSPEVARLVGGVAAQPPRPPRDPVDRAAQAVLEADGLGARRAASTCRSRCAASWSAASRCPTSDDGDAGPPRLAARVRRRRWRAALIELMPLLGHVKVVRQWAGPYDLTPRRQPDRRRAARRARVPRRAAASAGHGFMMAPVVARYYAAYLRGEPPHPFFDGLARRPLRRRRPAPRRATASRCSSAEARLRSWP